MMPRIDRILIAGGGTGGHVYPAVAVAEEVLRRNPDAVVTFVGTERGIESRVLPKLGYRLETLPASRLVGAGLLGRVKGLFRAGLGVLAAWKLLRRERPQIVLGVGGYVSGPTLLAAWLARYPTAVQEQNATPGLTNKTLGRLVRAVYLGFDAAAPHFRAPTVPTGNPLRRSVTTALDSAESSAAESRAADAAGAEDERALHVLVFGGSQGARFLNEQVPPALIALDRALAGTGVTLTATHQTGVKDEDATRERYSSTPLADRVTVLSYIDDMPAAYADADLSICRAGALTVAEITAVGLPALLVPFPHAAGQHQHANAQVLADAGAGRMVTQETWDADDVTGWLRQLAEAPARLRAMSDASRQLARLDAASRVVDHLEGLATPSAGPGGAA